MFDGPTRGWKRGVEASGRRFGFEYPAARTALIAARRLLDCSEAPYRKKYRHKMCAIDSK
jgi:hypothetical protein